MSRRLLLLPVVALASLAFALPAQAVPNLLAVSKRPLGPAAARRLLAQSGARSISSLGSRRIFLVKGTTAVRLAATHVFSSISHDRVLSRLDAPTPLPPAWANASWWLQPSDGISTFGIGATGIWDRALNAAGVTLVGVVDSGIDLNHPDLVSALWTNPQEVAGNGLDDDANGYADDVHGYDFLAGNADIQDAFGHGTHVAGIITGTGGVAPSEARLIIARTGGSDDEISVSAAIQGIEYTAQRGARVINCSWGGPGDIPALSQAIADAGRLGALVVVAAGNEGKSEAAIADFPAMDGLPNELAVAASDQQGQLASFSSYGPGVDLAAPGVNILSDWLSGGQMVLSGTSMATPMVSGVAALLFSIDPLATPSEVRRAILKSASPLAGLAGSKTSAGLLNAPAALYALEHPDPLPAVSGYSARKAQLFDVKSPAKLKWKGKVIGQVRGAGAHRFSWKPISDPELEAYRLFLDGQIVAVVPKTQTSLSLLVDFGQHSWHVVGQDYSGQEIAAQPETP